ncbi:MAG: hypothetical protein RL291_389 [Pseudomonadota bacterium]
MALQVISIQFDGSDGDAVTDSSAPEVVLIVAAGRGARMGVSVDGPKQYRDLGGRPVLAWSIDAFANRPTVREIVTVIHRDDGALYEKAIGAVARRVPLGGPVTGGATRQASVHAGLEALATRWPAETIVFIHDAVRPFVTPAAISAAAEAVRASGDLHGAMPGRAVADTLVRGDGGGHVTDVVARDGLFAVETPQVFRLGDILKAHRQAVAQGFSGTDDASVLRAAGGTMRVTSSVAGNFKITTADDLARARTDVERGRRVDVRTGQGFDVHTFGPGDHVWLGGVRIPHTHGVVAHSDGDVVLHALTDALLGTIADRDIGYHFRNTDPRWRGAPSSKFLEDAVARVKARGGEITLLDATVLAEAPKVGPHRDAMCAVIAGIAGITPDRVSIKATTTEGLGAFGRREGLAAMATATVVFGGG